MKHFLMMPFILFALSPGPLSGPPMPDPAWTYCRFMGYQVEIRKDSKGNESGYCLFPDGSECEVWDFFRGKCGRQYSYCARKGCETSTITEDKGSYEITYCACGCKDSTGVTIQIPLMQFMEQNGDTLIRPIPGRKGGS
jgi:putative hemolysin